MGEGFKRIEAKFREARRRRRFGGASSLGGLPTRRDGDELVVDVEAVARREIRFEETRERAEAFEASTEIDEQEKCIAALIAVSRYGQDAGCPRETLDRIHTIIDAFWNVQKGSRSPLFEPANPMHGKGSRLIDLFKATCVASVKTRRARRDVDTDNEARRRFLVDLWDAVPSSDAVAKVLFPYEGDRPAGAIEVKRQQERLSEWSKARQMDSLDPMARRRHDQLLAIANEHGPAYAERAYQACLDQAISNAKSLILHRG